MDTGTFKIVATQDFEDKSSTYVIISETINVPVNNDFEIPWFVIDEDQSILIVMTSQVFISYPLRDFFEAIKKKTNPPPLKKIETFKKFEKLSSVAVHNKYLYIAADGIISIYLIGSDGTVGINGSINKGTISADNADFGDMTFDSTGRFLFAIDELSGVHVFDITRVNAISWVTQASVKTPKADFVQIVGHSLNIIVSQGKNPSVTEYIIRYNSDDTPSLTFNRKTELSQSVKDVYADDNFLYLISGYINLALKHSIPGTYNNTELTFLNTAWISFGSVTMVSQSTAEGSSAVVLTRDYVEKFTFSKSSPELVCNLRKVPPNLYSFRIEAVQSTCDLKEINSNTDFNTVCIVKETINLIVGTDNKNIGDTSKSQYLLAGLVGGSAVLVILVIALIWNVRKHKNKYQLLESQIKSQSLQPSTKQHDNVLNLDTSLRNQEGSTSNHGGANIDVKKEHPKPPTEETKEDNDGKHGLGDKPLDVKGIYGDDGGDNPF